ncbi:MAG: hypothetical protein LW750_05775 [Bacteroidetes bacterium]|nr:hypothetical protein [Bacteroidota bacterium]
MMNIRLQIIRWCITLIALLFALNGFTQNLEKIGKKDMVSIGGGLQLNSIFYDAQGFDQRRDPFAWYFNGNVAVNILDVSLPFTFSYTNNQVTYTQPFNMQSVHPTYKWAKGHFGITSVNYSPFTLAGHVFAGGAIELTPKNMEFSAMYGRLKKAVAFDSSSLANESASFQRMGLAGKMGFRSEKISVSATYFHAYDDAASLLIFPAASFLTPMENTAVSIQSNIKLMKKFQLDVDAAMSGLTRNIFSEEETTDFTGWQKWMLTTRSTTTFRQARKFAFGYADKIFSVKLQYEHVDPNYQSLGAYFFNNDLQNITVQPAVRLFKGKLNLQTNIGRQRNNLDGLQAATSFRCVGSVNAAFQTTKGFSATASYSNFTAYTNRRPITDPFWVPTPADTLDFYQLAQQGQLMVVKSFGKKTWKNSISGSLMYQQTGQQQSGVALPGTHMANANIAWTIAHAPKKWSISLMSNAAVTANNLVSTMQHGPGLQAQKTLGITRISLGSTYNRSLVLNELQSHLMNHRFTCAINPKLKNKKYGTPSFSINANYVNRLPATVTTRATSELTVMVNGGYNF